MYVQGENRIAKSVQLSATVIILAGLFWAGSCIHRASPQLHFDDSVASDFRELANETWLQFLAVFNGRTSCFGDVYLQADPTLDSRATYIPDRAVAVIRVPGTPAFLQAALVHEWAHHIEYQCQDHQSLRPALLESLDLPSDTPWHIGHTWADTPSEQYAEAVVELVLSDHPLPTKIRVNRETVSLLAQWASK